VTCKCHALRQFLSILGAFSTFHAGRKCTKFLRTAFEANGYSHVISSGREVILLYDGGSNSGEPMDTEKKFKLPRRPTDVPLNDDEKLLFEHLEQIFEENVDAADFGHRSAYEAVHVVLLFLKNRGLAGQAMEPIIKVQRAFEDVAKGILPELFDSASAKKSGPAGITKWSRSSGAAEMKVHAAGLMTALMKQGTKKLEAAARVARAVQTWPAFSAGIIKATTIANWRDELMQSAKTDIKRQRYEHLGKTLTSGPRATAFLQEILHKGPPLTGGPRKKAKRSET
jgi:hypothetical protein